ncbi:MAG: LLM class flavin-dependent oxidoreductase [Gammaproteobacteria bacterium]|nr:LLM class flavin-dependent oxidoreductase [Gammaproteobacteria bacterium]MCP5198616.1 LLM class flavin-dependent oxidoreductase [Gammaproteobacteria bacterium]
MANAKLRFGLWYAFRNPPAWRVDYADLYAAHLRQIAWAETIGYDDVWLTEHHFCDDGHAPSILPLAAAVAATTTRIRIGTGVLLLPLYNAVRVAEDGATIDILSRGRFELGVGIGYRPQEFAGLGESTAARATRMDEGLEVIRALWSGQPVHYDGRHYQLDGLTLEPPPVQRPRPPLWVGGFAPAAARRAARLGDGFIGTGEMVEQSRLFREEWSRLGRSGEARLAGGHFWLVVSHDPAATFAAIAPHVLYQINVYNQWLADAGQALFPPVENPAQLRELGILACVTPQEAVDRIGAYAEQTGIERYYTWTVPPGYPVERMDEHLALFAEAVMPHFR